VAGFKSEWVAEFIPESVADFRRNQHQLHGCAPVAPPLDQNVEDLAFVILRAKGTSADR
jgi:hypothetical protein